MPTVDLLTGLTAPDRWIETEVGPSFHTELIDCGSDESTMYRAGREAIEIKHDEVIADPALMQMEKPYLAAFAGTYLVIVKRRSGVVDFYAMESA